MAQTEKELQKEVLEWLHAHPAVGRAWTSDASKVRARKFNNGKNKKGIVDIHGFLKPHGRYFAIELKVGYNDVSTEQAQFLFDVCNSGALGFAAWSLDEVRQRFKASGL